MKYRDKGRLQPPTAQGGEYIYSPPAWRVCGECEGSGKAETEIAVPNVPHPDCSDCHGTGRTPIRYTPEQWKEAGGVLSDDTPVMYRWMESKVWRCDFLGEVPSKNHTEMIIVIATEAGRPPEDKNERPGKGFPGPEHETEGWG